jgi:predicted RNase H-like HicB family nuclease
MRNYTAIVEFCEETKLFIGYIPGFPGAHTQAKSLDELNENLHEVIEMLLEDGEPQMTTSFFGVQNIAIV